MEKSDNRLVQIFEELQEKGLVRTKKEYAALLGAGYANLVNAMGGSPVSLTKSIIVKAEQLRTRLLNGDPAHAPAQKVEELSPAEARPKSYMKGRPGGLPPQR